MNLQVYIVGDIAMPFRPVFSTKPVHLGRWQLHNPRLQQQQQYLHRHVAARTRIYKEETQFSTIDSAKRVRIPGLW